MMQLLLVVLWCASTLTLCSAVRPLSHRDHLLVSPHPGARIPHCKTPNIHNLLHRRSLRRIHLCSHCHLKAHRNDNTQARAPTLKRNPPAETQQGQCSPFRNLGSLNSLNTLPPHTLSLTQHHTSRHRSSPLPPVVKKSVPAALRVLSRATTSAEATTTVCRGQDAQSVWLGPSVWCRTVSLVHGIILGYGGQLLSIVGTEWYNQCVAEE